MLLTIVDLSYMLHDMTNTERQHKAINPYSGQSEMLTKDEAELYDQIKQDEYLGNSNLVQVGLDKFSRLNAKAYMTLLD